MALAPSRQRICSEMPSGGQFGQAHDPARLQIVYSLLVPVSFDRPMRPHLGGASLGKVET